MKRLLIVMAALIIILFIGGAIIAGSIPHDVKENIALAKQKYPGKNAEDALIAFLQDTTNGPHQRSSVAIWTLGHIGSKKALPLLKELYKDDPKGETCHGRHDSVLCQRELHYAIETIEHNHSWFSQERYK